MVDKDLVIKELLKILSGADFTPHKYDLFKNIQVFGQY